MSNVELYSLRLISGIFDKSNSSLQGNAIAVINVSPNTFNISIVDILVNIGVTVLRIAGCKVIKSLALPNS